MGKQLSPLEFKFFFFPWWQEPSYKLEGQFTITREYESYFDNLRDKHGIILTTQQKNWYIHKKNVNQDKMFAEYPSTPDEAFHASIEGAYYSSQMAKVYEENRIRIIPYDERLEVDTYWDLGMNDLNVILFTQAYGNEIRFIDYYENRGEGLAHYVNVLKERGYNYGRHIFPHDIEVRNLDKDGKSRRETLIGLGLNNIRVIPRTKDVNDDIEGVRKLFRRFYFDEMKCESLIDACNNYRKEWDDKLGEFKNKPRHDIHSHRVDPLRLLGKVWNQHNADLGNSKETIKTVDFF